MNNQAAYADQIEADKIENQITQAKLNTIFDSLKPGQIARIMTHGPMASHDPEDYGKTERYMRLQVGRRTRSKKYNTEKISLVNPKNPHGCKHYLYRQNGKISLAHGDMAACLIDIQTD